MDDGLSQLDPLAHPDRILSDLPVPLFPEADELEHFVRPAHRGLPRESAHPSHVGNEPHAAEVRASSSRVRACILPVPGRARGSCCGSRPRTDRLPEVGAKRPRTSRRRVVFPDPFGPTRPIVPGESSTERFDSASTVSNRFVTESVREQSSPSRREDTHGLFGPRVVSDQ